LVSINRRPGVRDEGAKAAGEISLIEEMGVDEFVRSLATTPLWSERPGQKSEVGEVSELLSSAMGESQSKNSGDEKVSRLGIRDSLERRRMLLAR